MPPRDYTTYNQTGGLTLTVAPQQIDAPNVRRNEETYLDKSFGVGHFGDVDHIGSFVITAKDSGGLMMVYALTNTPDDAEDIFLGTGLQIRFFHAIGPNQNRINLLYTNGGSVLVSSSFSSYVLGTRIWWRLTRIGSAIVLLLYDDAPMSNLIATLGGTGDATTFEYHEPVASWNSGISASATGVIYGTDFQEVPAGGVGPLINGGLINTGLTRGRLLN